jgi:hypothetical protein
VAFFLILLLNKQKKKYTKYKLYICFIVHFLCLPKENEPKEKAAVHLVRLRRTTIAACKKVAASESSFAPPSRFPTFFLCCSAA